jgi:hypothetical protein
MTDISASTSFFDERAPMGPLDRSAFALNSIVLQLGLYAEMKAARDAGEMTPALEEQLTSVFAAVTEPAQA